MNEQDRIDSAASLLAEFEARPNPPCTVCGTTDRSSRMILPCHWCGQRVCQPCYYDVHRNGAETQARRCPGDKRRLNR